MTKLQREAYVVARILDFLAAAQRSSTLDLLRFFEYDPIAQEFADQHECRAEDADDFHHLLAALPNRRGREWFLWLLLVADEFAARKTWEAAVSVATHRLPMVYERERTDRLATESLRLGNAAIGVYVRLRSCYLVTVLAREGGAGIVADMETFAMAASVVASQLPLKTDRLLGEVYRRLSPGNPREALLNDVRHETTILVSELASGAWFGARLHAVVAKRLRDAQGGDALLKGREVSMADGDLVRLADQTSLGNCPMRAELDAFERAEEIRNFAEGAGLSAGEREIFELLLRQPDLGSDDEEIAGQIDSTARILSVQKARLRKKMRAERDRSDQDSTA